MNSLFRSKTSMRLVVSWPVRSSIKKVVRNNRNGLGYQIQVEFLDNLVREGVKEKEEGLLRPHCWNACVDNLKTVWNYVKERNKIFLLI